MRAYSPDLRARVLAAVEAGMSKCAAARVFGIDDDTIRRYEKQRRETGSLDPRPHPGRPPALRADDLEAIRAQLIEHPTAILTEHCALWEAKTGQRLSSSTMSRAFGKLGWTRKKDRWVPPSGMRSTAGTGGS